MKYQLGDKVLILHSEEEGIIIDFINDKMVMVDVKGIKFPVYTDQIDFPYYKQFTQKKKKLVPQKKYVDALRKETAKSGQEKKEDGVWLNFLPVSDMDEFGDEVVEALKIHLINNTSVAYQFSYALNFFGNAGFELKNTVLPFQRFYLHDVLFEDMSDSPSFSFDFSLQNPDKKKAEHFDAVIKIKPKQLFTKIEALREKNEAFFAYQLFDVYPDKPETETPLPFEKLSQKGFKVYNAKEARQHMEPARSVVDLHIEKLTDNWSGMSNYEMLKLQLKTFEKYYELAVAHLQPTLIIIHGVGTGKLRDEIHDALRLKKEVSYFVNQYHPSYGYGATEIFFKY